MIITRYSISDLEKLTGIKAHTIRIWEKRYGVISPERTGTNIRFYTVKDLQKLLNITFLNKHGFKISAISAMSDAEVQLEVVRLSDMPGAEEGFLSNLLKASMELDEDSFERNLNGCILKMGFEQSFQEVIFPLLEKINLLWQIGKISACQERFVNNLVRHKLVVAIDGMVGHNHSTGEHYLLYLPVGQYDEINLLYANYLLRKAGHHVIYLGPSITIENLRSLSNLQVINHLVVSISQGFTDKELISYTERLADAFQGKRIYLIAIGSDLPRNLPREILGIHSYEALVQEVSI
jgi:DNA-binding transcriptional MerR regulator